MVDKDDQKNHGEWSVKKERSKSKKSESSATKYPPNSVKIFTQKPLDSGLYKRPP